MQLIIIKMDIYAVNNLKSRSLFYLASLNQYVGLHNLP